MKSPTIFHRLIFPEFDDLGFNTLQDSLGDVTSYPYFKFQKARPISLGLITEWRGGVVEGAAVRLRLNIYSTIRKISNNFNLQTIKISISTFVDFRVLFQWFNLVYTEYGIDFHFIGTMHCIGAIVFVLLPSTQQGSHILIICELPTIPNVYITMYIPTISI